MIYLLTAIVLSPGGRNTVHIYTQTIHRTIQNKQTHRTTRQLEECWPCPVLASYNLAFALQPRKKHRKTSYVCYFISHQMKVNVTGRTCSYIPLQYHM